MRPGSILLAIACVLLACTTAAEGVHARRLRMSSPDVAQANDAVSNNVRHLRSREIDDNKTTKEERMVSPQMINAEGMLTRSQSLTKSESLQSLSTRNKHHDFDALNQMMRDRHRKEEAEMFQNFLRSQLRGPSEPLSRAQSLPRLDPLSRPERESLSRSKSLPKTESLQKMAITEDTRAMQLRSNELKLKEKELKLHDDINAKFNTYSQMFTEGETPTSVYLKLRILYLEENLSLPQLLKNPEYLEYVTYTKFYNIVKNLDKSEAQLQKERYDAVTLKKETLTSDTKIEKNFANLREWYAIWNTPEAVRKVLGIWRVSAKVGARFTEKQKLYHTYKRFYETMENEIPKIAP